jgi:hypothetical protein
VATAGSSVADFRCLAGTGELNLFLSLSGERNTAVWTWTPWTAVKRRHSDGYAGTHVGGARNFAAAAAGRPWLG